MAKVEKHRSSRRSGHRKRNDGGYSDTETDREVSSLTDRAFRSLCIGDEAVYNDSDLCASPCTKRDTDTLKRTAHESFSLRVQQYGQDWMCRGMYGAEIHNDQQWGIYRESGAQERLSSSYQSSVEAHQQETSPRELSLSNNGTTEVSSQQRRSNSRVSCLVKAFNSEGQVDEATYNDETSWDKSALMSIERELSEFSPYPQNMNTGYFPSTGLFSSQNTNYYSSEVAAQMNSASFMRSSHSMSTEVNSNFFIHSEFSPFKVWRDQNRFPFHGGQVSGFMPRAEFQKWYETPMYKELSLQPQQHPSMFSQGYQRNTFAPAIPMNPQRSTSASTMMPRASAVEKRCESELAGQYRKRAQSTGANRLPPQRPSTASPASDMSRRVRDTISSVKSLQQKIKMMAEHNLETQSQEGFSNNNYMNSYDPMVNNMVSSIPYVAPYQMQKSLAYPPSEQQQLLQQHSVSPQPVEHAPVRAESRGATPDIKMSSYKSRAASLLYNLKDNRKRVKATYSPNVYQGLETQEKYKQEAKDCVIDVPELSASELSNSTGDRVNRLDVPQYGYQPHYPGIHTQSSQKSFENPIDMRTFNVTQYGYQVCSSGMQHNSQHLQYSQTGFGNSVENNMLHVPQYGYYKPHSPGMLQNPQYKLANPMEGGMRLDVGQYGYQAHSPGMQQNMQFPQFTQNMQNSQQHYQGQSSSEYYRAQMQGEMAPHPGFSGYTPEYYANTQLANGQNPYENISSFTPHKQSLSDKGEGSYANWLEQNTEVQRFGPVVQSRDYVSKDNSRQQFNEAASGKYTGVDRYNQVKENKYDYNNVNSQDMWGQTNSRQIQKPAIPSAQNYQNINAYPRTSQENMLNYQYEQKAMDNYATRPQGDFNVSNQMLQHAPPHPASTGIAGYNTQPQPGTYRDIYAPPTSHKINKEIKMKENYAPQDNHKYYDQESKKQTIISSQAGMLIATEELVQRKGEAIKEIGIKGTRDFGNSKQEGILDKEKLMDISTRDPVTNVQVPLQQKKTEDAFAEDRSVQNKDLPTAEDLIKQLRRENSPNLNDVEVEKVTDKQEHMTYIEPQRREPESQQLIVEPANTEELKEEPIKCELATSSEVARIEQVKPEPSREERVITEEATEFQVGEETEAKEEDRNEAKQAATELLMEGHGDKKDIEYKDIDIIYVEEHKLPRKKNEKEADVTANAAQIPKEDTTNTSYVESLPNSESNKPETSEPDKGNLAKTKAKSAKLKEIMKNEQRIKKVEEHTEQENNNVGLLSTEPQFQMQNEAFTDRGADDFENIKDKYGYSQDTSRNNISTTSSAHIQATTADKKDQMKENKVDTNYDKQKIMEVLTKTAEDSENVGNPHDDPAGSQYVYSETSKDFTLSSSVPETKDICENVITKDVPIENINKSDASQKKDHAKQQHNTSEISESNLPNLTDKRTLPKNDACLQDNLTVDKLDKPRISKQKEIAKQLHMERKTKSIDQKGTSKETIKGLIQREKTQTKQELLTSKIKAHAEKEISAIKEGFAVKDGLKNPSKTLAIGQNVTIRQKPPSQEMLKKQDRSMSNTISKESQSQTAVSATGILPPDNMNYSENTSLKVSAATNMELTESKTTSLKMTTNDTVNDDQKCGYPTDGKRVKSHPEDKTLKRDSLSIRYEMDQASHEKKTPIQLQNEISAQDKSLEIMNIMVTVREQKPERVETQGQTEVLSAVVEKTIKSNSDKVSDSQGSNKTTQDTKDNYSTIESVVNNLTDKTSEKYPQQECSLPNERPQSEMLLPDHLVVPRTVTVPAKNNLLAETQHPPNKQDTISEETKVYANKPPNVALDSTLIKGQEEPTKEINLKSVSVTSKDTQEDNLHNLHVPVVTEEANKGQQRTVSNTSVTEDETPSNDDVQKVISSVRKQAQLLKNSKQSMLDNTPRPSNESDKHRNGNEMETISNEGYFQVDNRETVPRKCTDVEQSSENVSQESEHDSISKKDEVIKMSKETGNIQIDTKIKDEKVVAGNTRRHHMAKGRQRGVLTPHERPDNNVEVKPKPKVPIPEISALADYARLKVIVSKDDEDSIHEQPPHQKEGFFPLIQSRHSRRPVFTVDSQEDAVKGKGSQDQSEAQVKVSKEPATVVIPFTEKQPQRANMFNLGVKENPEIQKRKPKELTNKHTEDRIKDMLEKTRAKQAEEDKRAAQREEERRACEREAIAAQIRERRKKQREAERYAEEEGKGKVVEQQVHLEPEQKGKSDEPSLQQKKMMSPENDDKQKLFEKDKTAERNPDEDIRTVQKQNSDAHKAEGKSHVLEGYKEEQRKDCLEEPNENTTYIEEQKSKKLLEESQRKTDEQKKKDILEEQRRVQMEEQKRRLFLEEQRKRAALEEQEKQAAKTHVFLEEAAPEKKMSDETTGQLKQGALIMEKRVATMAHEEKQKPATLEEQQRRAAEKEQLRKIAEKEQYRQSAILEDQTKRAAVEEKQRQAALKEKEQRAALEEQQRRAAETENLRKMAAEEQQRRAVSEEKLRRDTLIEEQKRKAVVEEQLRKAAVIKEEQQKAEQEKAAEEQKRRAAVEEEQKRRAAVEEEQKRRAAVEVEQKRRAAVEEEQKKRAAVEEEQKKRAAVEEEQKKRAAVEEEQKRRAAVEEEQKKRAAVEEEQKKRAAVEEEQKKRAAVAEEQRRRKAAEEEQKRRAAAEEEQQRKAEEEKRRKAEEEKRRKAQIEEQMRKTAEIEETKRQAVHRERLRKMAEEEQRQRVEQEKATLEEQQRRAAEEKQRKVAAEEQLRRAAIEEKLRRDALIEEQKIKAAAEEQQRRAAREEQLRKNKIAEEEEQRKALIEEQRRQAAHEEQLRKMMEEERRQKAEQEKAALEEQKKRAAHEEQLRKAEEQKRKAAVEEEKKKRAAVEEEKKRRAAVEEEQKRRAAVEEEQKRRAAVEEEQKRRAAVEEEKKKRAAVEEEQKRRAAVEEEQKRRKAAEEEQKRKAAVEEEQKRRAHEEQLRKIAEEERRQKAEQEKAALEEQKKRAAHEEQLRKAEEQKRRAAVEEEQKRRAHEEQLRKIAEEERRQKAEQEKAALEEQKKRAAHEEQLKKDEEQKRRAAVEEEQKRRKAAEEEKKRRKAAEEEQKRKAAVEEEQKRRAHEEQLKNKAEEERQQKAEQEKAALEEQKKRAAHEEQLKKAEEQKRRAAVEEEQKRRAHEEQLRKIAEEERRQKAEQEKAALEEQKKRAAHEQQRKAALEEQQRRAAHEEQLRKAAVIEEQQRKAAVEEEQQRKAQIEVQRQIAAEEEARRQDAQIKKQRHTRQEEEETRLAYIREERIKRQIEEEKEAQCEEERNTLQQSSEENPTHKEKAQPWSQKNIRTKPVVNHERTEKYTSETTEALQYYSLTSEKVSPPQKRSNTNESETVEDTRRPHSFVSPVPSLPRSNTTSPAFGMKPSMFKVKDNTSRGTSLTKSIKPRFHKNFGEEYRVGSPMDRGWESDQDRCRTPSTPLPQHRPFSRRSLALDEEDSRSIISNMSEDMDSVATSAADLADIRGLYDSDRPESACSYSSDVSRSLGKPPAVPPKSEKGLRRAKRLATRRRKKESSKDVRDDSCETAMSEDNSNDVVASPHFTRPISIARAPPAGSSLSLSHSEESRKSIHTVPHAANVTPHTPTPRVTSSPTHHHVPKPVTQYQVESGFSQTYTQKRVMQDVGSGQYYVVDVPVEVKTKTFFDPETGKYVQLNVRESSRNVSQRQPLQGYPQGQLKPKSQAKLQPIPSNNAQYQSYPSDHKGYRSPSTSAGPVNQSMTPATRDQCMTGYGYSSDKAPYMDTVNNVDKPHHAIYNTQGSQGAISEGDDQLVNSRYKRDIITMSELEDFMEVSDW